MVSQAKEVELFAKLYREMAANLEQYKDSGPFWERCHTFKQWWCAVQLIWYKMHSGHI